MIKLLNYTINKESIEFLFNHDLLPKKSYDNIVDLQYDIDYAKTIIEHNVSYSKETNEPIYDSMLFAVLEYHVYNAIVFINP